MWLNLEIKHLHKKRSKLELELYELHLRLTRNNQQSSTICEKWI
jgi:hypothetical protein